MRTKKGSYNRNERPNGIRQKGTLLLVPVLAITLWLLVRQPVQTAQATSADTVDGNMTVSRETEDAKIDWDIPPVYRVADRDPMQLAEPSLPDEAPATPQTRKQAPLTLRGILYSADRPVAMIGTNLVHEGQQIAGVTVIEIARDSVEFEMDGQRWKQRVSDPAIPSRQDAQ